MVATDFLHDPEVCRWLGGVDPAWTLLDMKGLNALRRELSNDNRALRLANNLTAAEIAASAVTRNTLILLRRAADSDGLKLTATGNLSRTVVAEMVDLFERPDFDRAEAFQLHKVANESDFLPLFFVRHMAQFAKLARPYRSSLRATRVRRSEVSEATAREIDLAVRKIVEHAFAQATEILTARRKDLEAGAALLLQKEVITGDDFPPLLRAKDKALSI